MHRGGGCSRHPRHVEWRERVRIGGITPGSFLSFFCLFYFCRSLRTQPLVAEVLEVFLKPYQQDSTQRSNRWFAGMAGGKGTVDG